jgi:hypothetical protein
MGMFDYIKCEIQLPGYSFITNEEFQTKSFDNVMEQYVITAKGQIYCEKWDYEWVDYETRPIVKGYLKKVEGTYRRDYLTDLHGDIRFYNGIPIDGKKYDYFARFSYGKLDRLWMREWDRW